VDIVRHNVRAGAIFIGQVDLAASVVALSSIATPKHHPNWTTWLRVGSMRKPTSTGSSMYWTTSFPGANAGSSKRSKQVDNAPVRGGKSSPVHRDERRVQGEDDAGKPALELGWTVDGSTFSRARYRLPA
jgi:hypothetical protein